MISETMEGSITGIKIFERFVKVSGLYVKVHDAKESADSALHTIVYQLGSNKDKKIKFLYDERVNFASAEFVNNSNVVLVHDIKQDMKKYQTEELRKSLTGVADDNPVH